MSNQPVFGSSDRGHLGEAAAGLVDGALSHVERDLALSHIAHCDACRIEVEQQREIKARLGAIPQPTLLDSLSARLLAVPAMTVPRPSAPNRLERRREARRGRQGGPAYRPRRQRRVVISTSAFLAGAAALVLAVGGTERDPGRPVQPPLATLVNQHAATTGEVPFSDAGLSAVSAGFAK